MSIRPVSGTIEELRELLGDLDELEASLERRFNRVLFRRVRRLTGSQTDWAEFSGVSQATIGNWERGYTVPNRYYRRGIINACKKMRERVVDIFSDRQGALGRQLDIASASQTLNKSILRAALTDFDFDPIQSQIVPVPFEGDFDDELLAEIAEDRQNLVESLEAQARILIDSITDGANIGEQKIIRLLSEYEGQCRSESPNPRLLNRLGTTITRTVSSDDFRDAANDIDVEGLDGFARDHLELMRLYFKEALARAQEIDGVEVLANTSDISGEEFATIAGLMEEAVSGQGDRFVETSIPTLLRDIAGEIRDLNDSISLTNDPRRAEIFQRRKNEAFKNGSVYVGRFVFFAALLASVAIPGVPEIMTALGLMVGLTEGAAPGTIRARYDRLRERFQALPALPEVKDSDQNR